MDESPTRVLAVRRRNVGTLHIGGLNVRETYTRAFGDVARADPRRWRQHPRRRRESVSPLRSVGSGRGGGGCLPRSTLVCLPDAEEIHEIRLAFEQMVREVLGTSG